MHRTYERGISVIPDNSMLLYNATTLLDEMGDRERAVRYLYKSLEGDELLEDAYNYRACYGGQRDGTAKPSGYLTGALKSMRGLTGFTSTAVLYLRCQEGSRTLYFPLKRAYELNNRDQALIYNYAAVLIKLRQYTEAMQIYKTSLTSYPDDAELLLRLVQSICPYGREGPCSGSSKKSP